MIFLHICRSCALFANLQTCATVSNCQSVAKYENMFPLFYPVWDSIQNTNFLNNKETGEEIIGVIAPNLSNKHVYTYYIRL
jgi:hypothetical protein